MNSPLRYVLTLGVGALCLLRGVAQATEGTRSAVTPPARATLADFWEGRAAFRIDEGEQFGANFGMHFLSVQAQEKRTWAYFIRAAEPRAGDHRLAVGLASTTDGLCFDDLGTVLKPGAAGDWDDRMASFPGVWKEADGSWKLVYEGAGKDARWPGDVGLATSKDGKTWLKRPQPILTHAVRQPKDAESLELSWERNNIGTPSLWREGDTYYLFYHGFGASSGGPDDCQVGVATGRDLEALVRHTQNPVLRTGAAGEWDCGTIGKRTIMKEGDYYYMAYEGSTDQPYDMARWSTGLARSRDLLAWEKYPRPILPQTERGFGYDGPEWLRTPDGVLHLYFRAKGATGRATLAVKD